MEYAFPGSPALLDLDLDGFTDTIYIGDMGGNMWRVRMCTAADDNSCNTANWTVSRLFQPTGALVGRPIYTMPAAAKDASGEPVGLLGNGRPRGHHDGGDDGQLLRRQGKHRFHGHPDGSGSAEHLHGGPGLQRPGEVRLDHRHAGRGREGACRAHGLRRGGLLHELHPARRGPIPARRPADRCSTASPTTRAGGPSTAAAPRSGA